MTDVPAVMPVMIPVLPTEATEVLPLLQVPPVVVLLKVVVFPTQTLAVPVIEPASGSGLTITIVEVLPLPQLFVIV